MSKRIAAMLLSLVLIISMVPVAVYANEEEKEKVYISISDDEYYVLDKNGNPAAYVAVYLDDLAQIDLNEYGLGDYVYDGDGDGEDDITAIHLYIYVHTTILKRQWSEVTVTGSPGSMYLAGGLFGFSDENLRYDVNGEYPAVDGWGLTADQIVLNDGDIINVAHYSDWNFWMDLLTGFHYFVDEEGNLTHIFNIKDTDNFEATLVRGYSDWSNGGGTAYDPEIDYEVFYGKEYGNPEGSVSTDEDGKVTIDFSETGIWYVWADGGYGEWGSIVSAPAFCTVNVSAPTLEPGDETEPGNGGTEPDDETEPDNGETLPGDETDEQVTAVIELIEAINKATIFNGDDIEAAREAYNSLTDEQKQLVGNIDNLLQAESELDDIYQELASTDHKSIYEDTAKYMSDLGTPDVGSVGGEWMVIALTRAGYACPEGYYENVVKYVDAKINDKEQLHRSKSTDNSRVILGLTAAGYDVTNVNGHNLLMGLTDMNYLKKQGNNGPIWALIAFDCYDYEIPVNKDATEQVTREGLIDFILEKQLDDGGWSLGSSASDVDMTAMAMQALAPYYNTNEQVKQAVDRALVCLSDRQHSNGGFGSIDGVCSESSAQVIVALTALGINPETDARFVKNGISVVDAMCMFAEEDGGFAHIPNGGVNGMATEQSQYALAAYYRFLSGYTSLYNMSDVEIVNVSSKDDDKIEKEDSGKADNKIEDKIEDKLEETVQSIDDGTDNMGVKVPLAGDINTTGRYYVIICAMGIAFVFLGYRSKKRYSTT